jgi:hypothetical protein
MGRIRTQIGRIGCNPMGDREEEQDFTLLETSRSRRQRYWSQKGARHHLLKRSVPDP